jgi:hypothetical protein
MRYRYRARKTSRKNSVVEKCIVEPSAQEPDGLYYRAVEIVTRPIPHEQAYLHSERLNAGGTIRASARHWISGRGRIVADPGGRLYVLKFKPNTDQHWSVHFDGFTAHLTADDAQAHFDPVVLRDARLGSALLDRIGHETYNQFAGRLGLSLSAPIREHPKVGRHNWPPVFTTTDLTTPYPLNDQASLRGVRVVNGDDRFPRRLWLEIELGLWQGSAQLTPFDFSVTDALAAELRACVGLDLKGIGDRVATL